MDRPTIEKSFPTRSETSVGDTLHRHYEYTPPSRMSSKTNTVFVGPLFICRGKVVEEEHGSYVHFFSFLFLIFILSVSVLKRR